MHDYINCIAHNSSDGNLLIGTTHTALFDCGMAFCAEKTIRKIKNELKNRPLDYLFITHTHYDHIGALPYIKKEWNDVKVVTTQTGAEILLKNTPRRFIRELSVIVAKDNGVELNFDYDDDVFKADVIVKDNDIIELGEVSVQVLETPGHTRDSLSYFIRESKILILSETLGILLPNGSIYPCYLTSYDDAVNSIKKCRKIEYDYLSLPHGNIVNNQDVDNFFEKALSAIISCRNFIVDLKEKGLNEEELLKTFYEKYGIVIHLGFQPEQAFYANARATIAATN